MCAHQMTIAAAPTTLLCLAVAAAILPAPPATPLGNVHRIASVTLNKARRPTPHSAFRAHPANTREQLNRHNACTQTHIRNTR